MSDKPCLRAEESLDEAKKTATYSLRGRLIGQPECYEFVESARERIKDGYPHVILLLKDLEWCNSTGVGMIAALYTSTQGVGGKVYPVGANDRVRNILETCNLWHLLVPSDTLDEVRIQD